MRAIRCQRKLTVMECDYDQYGDCSKTIEAGKMLSKQIVLQS